MTFPQLIARDRLRVPQSLFWNALVEANGPFVPPTVVYRPFASHQLARQNHTAPAAAATGTSRQNEFLNRLYSREQHSRA